MIKFFLIYILISISMLNAKDLSKIDINDVDAKNAVIALNYMHSSLNKIVLYNDKIVLEEEYDNIINNINLTVIKDREIVNIIIGLMDTLTTFKLTEIEKEEFQKEYEEKLENAISEALSSVAPTGTNSLEISISFLINAGSAYMSYKENQKKAKKELNKNRWKLKKDSISELNKIRKDFLLTYWKIMKKYNMPDKWRITERQLTRFVEILKDNDIHKKYRQLLRMKDEMSVFPTYWYELSLIAHKLDKKDTELEAISRYEILDDRLLRDNNYYSLMLANKISYYNYLTESKKIINLLDKIYSIDPLNGERKLFVALKYQQMGYSDKAEALLNENIDDDFLPVLSQKLKIDIYLKDNKNKDYEDTISSLLEKQNLSVNEYLFYLGKKPLPKLVNEIQKEVKNIKIIFKKTLLGKDDLYISLPKKWVFKDIEDTELKISINNVVSKFTNITKKDDSIVFYYKNVIEKEDILDKKIKKITLNLVHKNIPLSINYQIKLNEDKKIKGKENHLDEENSYWGKVKSFTTDTISKAEDKYEDYTKTFKFVGESIVMQNNCFDLQNSLKACKLGK